MLRCNAEVCQFRRRTLSQSAVCSSQHLQSVLMCASLAGWRARTLSEAELSKRRKAAALQSFAARCRLHAPSHPLRFPFFGFSISLVANIDTFLFIPEFSLIRFVAFFSCFIVCARRDTMDNMREDTHYDGDENRTKRV